MYSDEQKDLVHQYPKIGKVGLYMLEVCRQNGVYSSEKGRELLEQIESYFNGQEIEDKEFQNNVQAWYEGTFCPGYFVNDNDSEFANYLKRLISNKILVKDD